VIHSQLESFVNVVAGCCTLRERKKKDESQNANKKMLKQKPNLLETHYGLFYGGCIVRIGSRRRQGSMHLVDKWHEKGIGDESRDVFRCCHL
jgi:hypothetical protein